MSNTGLFTLHYLDDGVYIMLSKKTGFIGPILRNDIINQLKRKKIVNFDIEKFDKILQSGEREGIIAPQQQEFLLDEDVKLEISRDKLTATMIFSPPDGGKLLNIDDLTEMMNKSGISFGIIQYMLASLSGNNKKAYGIPVLIAQGKVPVRGKDAWVEFHFNVVHDKMPRILPDGTVDHKNLGIIQNVQEDDLLVTLHNETMGTNGMNIFGQEVVAEKGRVKVLPRGNNTKIVDNKLLASSNGRVEVVGSKVVVMKILEIRGDVAVPTGHVHFLGDVIISGDVASKYNVSASGSIQVGGCVEGSVISAGRDIIIRHGVKGMSVCEIKAGGNITAQFIENAKVHAGGIIRCDSILQSTVTSGEAVIVAGKRGNITSSTVRAFRDIVCQNIGGSDNMRSYLDVGITPELRQNYYRLEKEITEMLAEQEKCEQLINILEEAQKKSGLTDKQQKQKVKLISRMSWLEDMLPPKQEDAKRQRNSLAQAHRGRVHIRNMVNSDTFVMIGSFSEQVKRDQKNITVCYENGTIEIIPYCYNPGNK